MCVHNALKVQQAYAAYEANTRRLQTPIETHYTGLWQSGQTQLLEFWSLSHCCVNVQFNIDDNTQVKHALAIQGYSKLIYDKIYFIEVHIPYTNVEQSGTDFNLLVC